MKIGLFLAIDPQGTCCRMQPLLEDQPDMQIIGKTADDRDLLTQIAQFQPDVVIICAAFLQLRGTKISRKIQNHLVHMRNIMLFDEPNIIQIAQALQAGSDGILLLETADTELVHAVHTVHAGGRYLSQTISDMLIKDYVQQGSGPYEEGIMTRLSPRERDVLQLVAEKKSSVEIAELLSLSPKTIKTYRSRLMHKLRVRDVSSLAEFAVQNQLRIP